MRQLRIMLSVLRFAALVLRRRGRYYPGQGYGSGYNNNNNVVGNILNSILGGQNYQQNDRYAIDMCVRATEARLNGYNGAYSYNNYGNYGGYGNNGYNQGYNGSRVTRITNVERRNSGLKVYGLATAGYNSRYGGYNQAMATRATVTRDGNRATVRQPLSNNLRSTAGQLPRPVTDVDIDVAVNSCSARPKEARVREGSRFRLGCFLRPLLLIGSPCGQHSHNPS